MWAETPHDAYLYLSSSYCFTFFYSALFSFILLYSFMCRKDTDNFRMDAYVGRNSVSSIGQNQSLTSLLN